MRPRLTTVVLLAALLAPPATVVDAAVRGEHGRASHACCPEQMRPSCHGQVLTCCQPDDGATREATVPVPSAWSHGTSVQLAAAWGGIQADVAAAARLAARLAHEAAARLHAPPDPLFLKHSVLLV